MDTSPTISHLPNILITDPIRQNTYYIPSNDLNNFLVTTNNPANFNSGTVTFVIPDENESEEISPFIDPEETQPSVLIQCRKDKTAYFLSYDILNSFRIDLRFVTDSENTVSFIIPMGFELIEELKTIRRVGVSDPR